MAPAEQRNVAGYVTLLTHSIFERGIFLMVISFLLFAFLSIYIVPLLAVGWMPFARHFL